MAWINDDGLKVRFDAERITRVEGGEYQGAGANRVIEIEIDAASIGTSATLFGEGVIVPRNSRIDKIEVVAETALTNLTSIDLGLQRLDFTTELDYDGLVNDILLANMNVNGERTEVVAGGTFAGALVGTTTLYPGRFVATRTGTVGVGKLVVRLYIYVPGADVNVNNY